MTVTLYDPNDWLVTANRALRSYIEDALGSDIDVEMNFPDVEHAMPFTKPMVHVEQDDITNPIMGFGTPGVEEFGEVAGVGTWQLVEAQPHLVNFDIGVWVSRQSGGATTRMRIVQQLVDLFSRPEAKKAMKEATGGLWPVSFNGGRNEIDTISDISVWRALDMTLIVRVVSRHVPPEPVTATGDYDQDPNLTIVNDAGDQSPVN